MFVPYLTDCLSVFRTLAGEQGPTSLGLGIGAGGEGGSGGEIRGRGMDLHGVISSCNSKCNLPYQKSWEALRKKLSEL